VTRRERIAHLDRLERAALLAEAQLRGAERVPMPPELAERVRVLAEAARSVADLAGREIRCLESARDWPVEAAP